MEEGREWGWKKAGVIEAADSEDKCGIGLVLRENSDASGVRRLTVRDVRAGSPAALCPNICIGDVLLKVDGKSISTAKEAGLLIPGARGTAIQLVFTRVVGAGVMAMPVAPLLAR